MGALTITISANSVAWYGAVVATASALIATANYLGDKRKLKVKVTHGLFVGNTFDIDEKMMVFVGAANVGKRPVTVNSAGFRFRNGQDIVLMETPGLQLPFTVEEGKKCQTWIEKKDLVKAMKKQKSRIKFGWYTDSTGKLYKGKYKINDVM
jgi:hypothetical protein